MGFFLFSREEREDHVNNREVLHFATGLAGQNISYSFISNRLVYFYENHMMSKERQHWVGKFMTATYVWDAINDILVGGIVDKRKHKPYQKMRPYLLYMPPFIGLLCALMFVNLGFGDVFKIVWLSALYAVWDLLYSFQDVALWGLLPLSTPHPGDRSRITHWVTVGAGAGATLSGMGFPVIWDLLKGNMGMAERLIFTIFAFVFGLGGELLSLDAALFRERVDSPYHEEESFFQSLAIVRHNPTLIFISLARFSLGLSPKINQTYFFQSEYRTEKSGFLKGGLSETLYGVVSGAPGAIALLFAGKLIPLFGGMKKTLVVSQVSAVVMRVVAFFVGGGAAHRDDPKVPGFYSTVPGFLAVCACVAVFNVPGGLMDVAHRSLTSDSIDEVELKTGIRTEGVSFAMQNFTTKFSGGISNLIQNFFLFHVLYYKKEEGDDQYIYHQGDKFYRWQYPLFMLGPIVGALLYLLFISFVKDSEERRTEVEHLLKERREAEKGEVPAAVVE